MARTKGTYNLSANIETNAAAPLDARDRVTTKNDLTASGSFPYPYIGMQVYVLEEGKRYTLKASDPTVLENWEESSGATQVQADWNETDNSKADYIKNKPTIPDAQIQADWTQSDNTKKDYIKNKPNIPSTLDDLSDVDTSGAGDGNALCFDTVKQKWIPSGPISFSRLAYLLDVSISSEKNGQVLKYNSSSQKWENKYPHIYNTSEQVVALWTDGKPVYERTFNLTKSDFGKNNDYQYNFLVRNLITNIKKIINISGTAKITVSGWGETEIPYGGRGYYSSSTTDTTKFIDFCGYYEQVTVKSFNNGGFNLNTGSSNWDVNLTFRYTKTTD